MSVSFLEDKLECAALSSVLSHGKYKGPKGIPKPQLFIAQIALEKMGRYVGFCSEEISWLGVAKRQIGDFSQGIGDVYIIEDVFTFAQDVSAVTTEITPEGLGSFALQILEQKPQDAMEILNHLRVWGHSHVDMNVAPSHQDDAQMEVFASSVAESSQNFMLRLIANKKGDTRVDIFDYTHHASFYNTPWTVLLDDRLTEQTMAALDQQIMGDIQTLLRAHVEPARPARSQPARYAPHTPRNAGRHYADYYNSPKEERRRARQQAKTTKKQERAMSYPVKASKPVSPPQPAKRRHESAFQDYGWSEFDTKTTIH